MPYTTTGGVKKLARYRYNFEIRRTPDSDNDFTNVFSLIDAANSSGTPNYVANMENIANMENWMRVFAANHAAGNWDSFGCAKRPKSLRLHRHARHKIFAADVGFQHRPRQQSVPGGRDRICSLVNAQDPNMSNIYNNPASGACIGAPCRSWSMDPLNVANSGPLLRCQIQCLRR